MRRNNSDRPQTLSCHFYYSFGPRYYQTTRRCHFYLYILCDSDSSSTVDLVLIGSLFVCTVDRGVHEGEPVNEQYCEQENEDQFRDPEPEGQDFPEGYEDGKFNPIL